MQAGFFAMHALHFDHIPMKLAVFDAFIHLHQIISLRAEALMRLIFAIERRILSREIFSTVYKLPYRHDSQYILKHHAAWPFLLPCIPLLYL